MRWVAIFAILILTACAAEPKAEEQVTSIVGECSGADECKTYIELQKTKAKLLEDVDGLLETPDEIKKDLRREYLKANENKTSVSATGVSLKAAYTDEELEQVSERLNEEPKNELDVSSFGNFERSIGYRGRTQNYISCHGIPQQGGAVLCQTKPNAKVKVSRGGKDFYYEKADGDGQIIVGFDRDEDKAQIAVGDKTVEYFFTARDYDTSRIDGLPPSQVSTFTEAQLKRIRSSSARKKVGFSSRAKEMGFRDGFISPIKEFRKTTNFGAQRILNGEPKKPHYGVDMAAPVGTPIYAPADGVVSLADDDLYFEGAMVLLDHGQGLISMYLHTDEILVEPGQRVKQGEQIATVGSKGRSTGPHLCWRLKWRNRNLDPELLTEWPNDEH